MVKLLVDSGAQIDMKDNVSTEPSIVLRLVSSLLSVSPHIPLSLSLSLLSPFLFFSTVGHALVIVPLL